MIKAAPAVMPGQTVAEPLSWYSGNAAPIFLRNQDSSADVVIPLQSGRTLSSVVLNLSGMNSTALQPQESAVLVSVNGVPVQQVPLSGGEPNFSQSISIPPALFNAPYNTVSFSVAQTTGVTCEAFDAPQLWTSILPSSTLSFTYTDQPAVLKLTNLGGIFDKHVADHEAHVTILYSNAIAASPQAIMAAAQSVAVWYDYVPVTVTAAPYDPQDFAAATAKPGNVILLGNFNDMQAAYAPAAAGAGSADARLYLQANPAGGTELFISGKDASTIAVAAGLVGNRAISWPSNAMADISINGAAALTPPAALPLNEIDFASTGFQTQTVRGLAGSFPAVNFWNPNWDNRVMLNLHIAYSGGMAPGSMLNVLADNVLLGTIPLNLQGGGTYPDYQLAIPQNILQPGQNQLVFQQALRVQDTNSGFCSRHDTGQELAVTLFADSTVSIIGGQPVQPDNLAALPLGAMVVPAIYAADADPADISAAATLGARLAQTYHQGGITFATGVPDVIPANSIVTGALPALPAPVASAINVDLGANGFGLSENPAPAIATLGASDFYISTPGSAPAAATTPPQVAIGNFTGSTIAASYPAAGGAAIIVAANSDADLQQGVNALVDWTHWSQLAGQAAIVTPGQAALQITAAMIVPKGMRGYLGYMASDYPYLGALAVLLVLLVAVIAVRVGMIKRRNRLFPKTKLRDDAA